MTTVPGWTLLTPQIWLRCLDHCLRTKQAKYTLITFKFIS